MEPDAHYAIIGRSDFWYLQAAGKKIKLICTDVDGTLLNSEQELTEPVLEAITAANNMGIPVCCSVQHSTACA